MGRRRIDLTGQRFGSWTVLGFSHVSDKGGHAFWECGCDCGTQTQVAARNLRRGVSTQCRECSNLSRRRDLTGERFGRWTVLERAGEDARGNSLWLCRCDCGKEKTIVYQNLVQGLSTQCRSCANRNRTLN